MFADLFRAFFISFFVGSPSSSRAGSRRCGRSSAPRSAGSDPSIPWPPGAGPPRCGRGSAGHPGRGRRARALEDLEMLRGRSNRFSVAVTANAQNAFCVTAAVSAPLRRPTRFPPSCSPWRAGAPPSLARGRGRLVLELGEERAHERDAGDRRFARRVRVQALRYAQEPLVEVVDAPLLVVGLALSAERV
jgi:hypothetical protein